MPRSDGLANQLFLDASGFARQVAQIIQFSTADVATALDFDRGDLRRIQLESTLDGFARRDLAHGERGIQAPVAAGDDHAFVGLGALARAFDHVDAHDDRIAGGKIGDGAAFGQARDFFFFEGFDQVQDRLQGIVDTGRGYSENAGPEDANQELYQNPAAAPSHIMPGTMAAQVRTMRTSPASAARRRQPIRRPVRGRCAVIAGDAPRPRRAVRPAGRPPQAPPATQGPCNTPGASMRAALAVLRAGPPRPAAPAPAHAHVAFQAIDPAMLNLPGMPGARTAEAVVLSSSHGYCTKKQFCAQASPARQTRCRPR